MRAARRMVLGAGLFLLMAGSCACARRTRPVVMVEASPVVQPVDRGPTSSESDVGGLNQEDVDAQFKALHPAFLECVQRSASRMVFVGGRVSLRVRVDRQGKVRWVFPTDSTLGDREAERCVMQVVRDTTWPRPLSGDGLAESSFEVDPTEPAPSWPKRKASAFVQKAQVATRKCRRDHRGTFLATAYIGPGGEVLSAGVAPPDARADEASDCIARALRSLRLGALAKGQRGPAKVSVVIR